MLESIRKIAAFPRVPVLPLASIGVFVTFFWLLAQNDIHPFVIYLAQLYLTF